MNDALLKFQREVCPELSIDDPRLTVRLIDEISKLKKDMSSVCSSHDVGVEKSPQNEEG